MTTVTYSIIWMALSVYDCDSTLLDGEINWSFGVIILAGRPAARKLTDGCWFDKGRASLNEIRIRGGGRASEWRVFILELLIEIWDFLCVL